MPAPGFVSVRVTDKAALDHEAGRFNQQLCDFISVLLVAWQELPREQQWQHIEQVGQRRSSAVA